MLGLILSMAHKWNVSTPEYAHVSLVKLTVSLESFIPLDLNVTDTLFGLQPGCLLLQVAIRSCLHAVKRSALPVNLLTEAPYTRYTVCRELAYLFLRSATVCWWADR